MLVGGPLAERGGLKKGTGRAWVLKKVKLLMQGGGRKRQKAACNAAGKQSAASWAWFLLRTSGRILKAQFQEKLLN